MIKKMTYLEKTKLRTYYGLFLVLVGIITFAISIYFNISMEDTISHYREYNSGVFSGLGGALIGVGIVTFYKYRKYLKDPVKFRKAEIKENDERNIYINQRALSISALVWIMVLYFTMIGAAFFDSNVSMILGMCACVAIFVYVGIYFILRKIY